jgi:hypothetical protein
VHSSNQGLGRGAEHIAFVVVIAPRTSASLPVPCDTAPDKFDGHQDSSSILGIVSIENSSPAVLHAYSTANLGQELYNNNQAGSRDQFGPGNKFIIPVIVNGKVYVGTTNGVAVFGLLHQAIASALIG